MVSAERWVSRLSVSLSSMRCRRARRAARITTRPTPTKIFRTIRRVKSLKTRPTSALHDLHALGRAREVSEDGGERESGDEEQAEARRSVAEDDLSDAEERGVDEDDAEKPVDDGERAAGDRLHAEAEPLRDARPAAATGPDAAIEALERLVALGLRRERDGEPDERGGEDRHEHDDGLDAEALGGKARV